MLCINNTLLVGIRGLPVPEYSRLWRALNHVRVDWPLCRTATRMAATGDDDGADNVKGEIHSTERRGRVNETHNRLLFATPNNKSLANHSHLWTQSLVCDLIIIERFRVAGLMMVEGPIWAEEGADDDEEKKEFIWRTDRVSLPIGQGSYKLDK